MRLKKRRRRAKVQKCRSRRGSKSLAASSLRPGLASPSPSLDPFSTSGRRRGQAGVAARHQHLHHHPALPINPSSNPPAPTSTTHQHIQPHHPSAPPATTISFHPAPATSIHQCNRASSPCCFPLPLTPWTRQVDHGV